MRSKFALAVFVVFSCLGSCLAGHVSSGSSRAGKDTLVYLKNDFFRLDFAPARGGRCTSFRFRDNGEELIEKNAAFGMFLDHWAKYTWPSGLMHLPYSYEIVGDNKTTVGIRLWVTVPAMGGGKGDPSAEGSLKMPTSPDLIGLIVRKTILIHADRDVIDVDQEIINPLKESRVVAPYIQQCLNLNGSMYHDVWYMPSTRGVDLRMMAGKVGEAPQGVEWVLDPTAGWIGLRDTQTDRGVLFAFDYNYLLKVYTSGSTAEWFMDGVPVAPGKSFATHYVVKPVRGFENFTYGSVRLVANIQPHESGKEVRVLHDLAAVSGELSNVRAELTVADWKSKKELLRKEFSLDRLTFAKTRQEFTFQTDKLTDGVVIRARVTGSGWEERYETYYDGDQKAIERRTAFFQTKGGALPGGRGDQYYLKPPRKHKQIDKPVLSAVRRPTPDHFKCLAVFGLYTHILNIDDALASWKAKGVNPVEFTWVNCPPNAIETFPGSYEELFSYNAIVLSDVNYLAIGDIGFEMLCDYVQEGGNLLVVGGPYALGNGEFEDTRFAEILPVKLSGAFDLKWAGKGNSWLLKPAKADDPMLKGLSFDQKPRVYWHHFVKPRPAAQVVLEAANQPCLIRGQYGKGKIVVVTLSPTGDDKPGEVAWWSWTGWPVVLQNIFTWFEQ